jgi:predicted aconitase with swiveling domain
MIIIKCRCIVKGLGGGEALLSDRPINFLTMIDPENAVIKDPSHELHGKSLKDKILVFPHSVGSSVGAYVLYSLKKKSVGPSAIICSDKMDITTASGCAISNIPAVDVADTKILNAIKNGQLLTVDGERGQILVNPQSV